MEVFQEIVETFPTELILHLADDTRATVYNAEASQCNADFLHTASNFTINPDSIASYHIVAMERTMMKQYGISYGDRILVKGAGEYDGVWNVHDTMNVRFRGQHRIDFLVPSDIKTGRWENVTIYKII